MGKISQKDTDDLIKSGVLSKKALSAMTDKKLIAKSKTTVKRFMKTADGKFVEPQLYFRGAKGATPSKKMEEFTNQYYKLRDKYTTTKTNNK
tara:strand:- start:2211 stop:2486 length:276 start_codon:yes stop_codon:yes gene_type:complete